MAEISIPPPDGNGYWHFTYITTDPVDGRWYGGKRSTRKHPLTDQYRGSGNWVRLHPVRQRLKREIIAFYRNSADVFAAEAAMVTLEKVLLDPFCMNQREGGEGMTVEYARRRSTNPQWIKRHEAALRHIHADPVCRAAHLAGVRRNGARPEVRAASSERLTRLWQDTEYRTTMAAAAQARVIAHPVTPEHIERMVAKTRGKKRCPEAVERGAAKRRGQKRTPEMKARISAAAVISRAKMSPEDVAAVAARLKASRETPEARANNRDAAARRAAAQRAAKACLTAKAPAQKIARS